MLLLTPTSQLVRIQSAYLPGYNAALASSIRDGPLRSLAPQFAALGRHSRKTGGKVLVIWVSPRTHSPRPGLVADARTQTCRERRTRSCHTAMPRACRRSSRIPSSSPSTEGLTISRSRTVTRSRVPSSSSLGGDGGHAHPSVHSHHLHPHSHLRPAPTHTHRLALSYFIHATPRLRSSSSHVLSPHTQLTLPRVACCIFHHHHCCLSSQHLVSLSAIVPVAFRTSSPFARPDASPTGHNPICTSLLALRRPHPFQYIAPRARHASAYMYARDPRVAALAPGRRPPIFAHS